MKRERKQWCCVNYRTRNMYVDSIAFTRKDSIKLFIKGAHEPWPNWQKWGWRCVKVLVTIEEIK